MNFSFKLIIFDAMVSLNLITYCLTAILLTTAALAGDNHLSQPYGIIGFDFSSERSASSTGSGESTASYRQSRIAIESGYSVALAAESSKQHALNFGVVVQAGRGYSEPSELSLSTIGLSLGWRADILARGQLYLGTQYIFFGELKSTTTSVETLYRDGSGYSLVVRWLQWWDTSLNENSKLGFGPSLTFERMSYAKSRTGSLPDTANGRTVDSVRPGLVSWFYF